MGKIVLNGKEYISTLPSPFPPLIYSTDEREIGVWIDGSPLYEKTKQVSINLSNGRYQDTLTSFASNLKQVISMSGTFINSAGTFTMFIPRNFLNFSTNQTYGYSIFLTDNKITLEVGSDTTLNGLFAYTVRYTKTTDTPGSGHWGTNGAPAKHYSTTEQVIGTWIDGKPIYEKTWDLGGTGLEISYNSWTSSTISKSGINTIINVESRNGTGGAYFGDVMASTEVDNTYIAFQTARNGNNERIRYVTLQYTKTTD